MASHAMTRPDLTSHAALRHAGVPETVRRLTQVSFIIRLVAILVAMVASAGSTWDLVDILIYLVLGGLSFFGLMNTRFLSTVREHPMIALLDALLVAVVVAASGLDSPLILAALTTALLVGLWVDVRAGTIVIASLLLLYLSSLSREAIEAGHVVTTVVVVPFVYVTFWALGLTVTRTARQQQTTDALVRDAVATAAASEERTKVARELHDSLAKTLQGMTLTATAIPALMEHHPEQAKQSSEELRHMGVTAVAQVRDVMTGLRRPTSDVPLSVAVVHLATLWQQRQERAVEVSVEDIDTSDETVRYELLTICEEALENVAKYAGPCRVRVSLRAEGNDLVLVIEDFGKGTDQMRMTAASGAGHHGVIGMHERMARIGGLCTWTSRPGEGTRVECRVHRSGLVER